MSRISDSVSVVAVKGDDDALVRSVVATVIDEALAARGVDATERRGLIEHTDELDAVLDAVATPSMFAPLRVVVLDSPVDSKALDKVVANTVAPDVVVVRVSARTRPKTAQNLLVVPASAPRNVRDTQALVSAAADRAGVLLDARTTQAVADRVGADVATLDSVMSALSMHADGGRVSLEHVDALVDEGASANPFAFVDAIEAGDADTALTELARLAGPSGWAPLRTLGLLRNRWMSAWRISCGAPVADTYPAKQQAALARRLGPKRMATAVSYLTQAEASVKGFSGNDPQVAVEVAVGRLARLVRSASK